MAASSPLGRSGEDEGKGSSGDENTARDADHQSSESQEEGEERETSATVSPQSSPKNEAGIKTSSHDATGRNGATSPSHLDDKTADSPFLPNEAIPPLPSEPPPSTAEQDDGWAPIWEENAQAFYFYNRFTGASQWTNPRVPDASTVQSGPPGVTPPEYSEPVAPASSPPSITGYNPAIHGDYDPTAWYAQPAPPAETAQPTDAAAQYAGSAAFNRFTGRYQNPDLTPENFNDENKSKRQMNAYFDVDAAANSHDGRSLKAERSGKKLSKQELKQFKEKRKAKKEEKRRAWLRD